MSGLFFRFWRLTCVSSRCSTFNFTVPFLSTLAILMLLSGAIVLYLIPMRYLIMAGGVNKFARKLIRPHTVPNNEVLDLLSRVPDDEDLVSEPGTKLWSTQSKSSLFGAKNKTGDIHYATSIMDKIMVFHITSIYYYVRPLCVWGWFINLSRQMQEAGITNNKLV